MQKFPINKDAKHKLDYSPKVGGVWLDAGEWEYLKEQGIACSLNKIFTEQWQKQLRSDDTKSTLLNFMKKSLARKIIKKSKRCESGLTAKITRQSYEPICWQSRRIRHPLCFNILTCYWQWEIGGQHCHRAGSGRV